MSLHTYSINTNDNFDIINIDNYIKKAIKESNISNGSILVYSPHTTAGITINENGDPDVQRDLKFAFNILSPKRKEYLHFEGNSHSHLLSTLIGASESLILQDNRPVLGTWQSVYFCEFDGPRRRNLYIKIMEG